MDFTRGQLSKKFNSKKLNAKNKGIPFTLTKEQYINMYTFHNGFCDYTGEPMSTDRLADDYVSLERVDSNTGYTASNVCLIRSDVNQLKGASFDCVSKEGFTKALVSLERIDMKLLVKLCDTLYSPDKIAAIKNKYEVLFDINKETKDNTITTHTQEEVPVTQTNTDTTTNKNPELQYTHMYYTFGTEIESLEGEFNLSYSDYKRLITRKYCQLTDKVLTTDSASVWVIDKSLPVCKKNILIVDKFVSGALDMFMVNGKLNLIELKKLCKNLISKGE